MKQGYKPVNLSITDDTLLISLNRLMKTVIQWVLAKVNEVWVYIYIA